MVVLLLTGYVACDDEDDDVTTLETNTEAGEADTEPSDAADGDDTADGADTTDGDDNTDGGDNTDRDDGADDAYGAYNDYDRPDIPLDYGRFMQYPYPYWKGRVRPQDYEEFNPRRALEEYGGDEADVPENDE